jgi:hypothetical protein
MEISDQLLDKLISDTLKKKPVNSDSFCIIRKVSPGEKFSKNPKKTIQDSKIPLDQRIKEMMSNAGFSYGRLKEKNWVIGSNTRKNRMIAPGPVFNSIDREVPKVRFDDTFQAKYPNGFDKPSYSSFNSHLTDTKKYSNPSSQHYLSQSPSRKQAQEYLQFLTAISPEEKKILQKKIDVKVQDYKKELHSNVPKKINVLNNRGIFKTEVNDLRANSMLSVKLRNQMKIKLEPIVRSVKAEVLKERIQTWNEKTVKVEDDLQSDPEKRNKLLKYISDTVSKVNFNPKSKYSSDYNTYTDTDWTEAIYESINKMRVKFTPKDQFE